MYIPLDEGKFSDSQCSDYCNFFNECRDRYLFIQHHEVNVSFRNSMCLLLECFPKWPCPYRESWKVSWTLQPCCLSLAKENDLTCINNVNRSSSRFWATNFLMVKSDVLSNAEAWCKTVKFEFETLSLKQ